MELSDLQRIRKVVKWLIFSGFGENEKELAEYLGYTNSAFSQILNGKVPISDKFINKLVSLDKNINKVWIKTGNENLFIHSEKDKYTSILEKQINLLEEKIAFLEQQLKYYKNEN